MPSQALRTPVAHTAQASEKEEDEKDGRIVASTESEFQGTLREMAESTRHFLLAMDAAVEVNITLSHTLLVFYLCSHTLSCFLMGLVLSQARRLRGGFDGWRD